MALTGPSKTARGAAGYRAAHQSIDGATVFRDPFARLILEPEALAEADERARDPASRNNAFSWRPEAALLMIVLPSKRQTVCGKSWCWAPAWTPLAYVTPTANLASGFRGG